VYVYGLTQIYRHFRVFFFTGCSVFERYKLGPILARRRASSHALRTSHFSKTAARRQHAGDVRTRKRPKRLGRQVRGQTCSPRTDYQLAHDD